MINLDQTVSAVNVLEGQTYGKRIEPSEERGWTGVALKKQAGTQLGRRSAAAIAEAAHQAFDKAGLGRPGNFPLPSSSDALFLRFLCRFLARGNLSARLGRGLFRRVLPVAGAGVN